MSNSSFRQPVQQNRNFREFNVGDNEEFEAGQVDVTQFEQDVKAARLEKTIGTPKISDGARKRIELLANIGRLTKDVSIGGVVFTIRTLKSKEARDAATLTFTTSLTQLDASFEVRRQQLARSLIKIDGNSVGDVIGDASIEATLSFIEDELEDIVVNKLFDEFVSLKKEAQNKYGLNSNEDVKEVIEDLKK